MTTVADPSRTKPARSYYLDLTCPHDGGVLMHQTGGRYGITEARAIVNCDNCGRGYVLSVFLHPSPSQAAVKRRLRRRGGRETS